MTDFDYLTHKDSGVISDLASTSIVSPQTIIVESEFTNMLQLLVDYGNSNVYKSFKIRLEIEEENIISSDNRGFRQ